MITRIASMVLRLCAVAALTLGILFWTGHADNLHNIHMTVGMLLVLALWVIAFARMKTPGGVGALIAALTVGVLLALVGMTQEQVLPGANHWVIQVVHLGLALVAIGIGEMLARRGAKAVRFAKQAA
ncbi:MAG TPA: hypothetical protein VKQ30_00615 [Ktedonobacterales bacterium]|nr:hypothetical protein [Ktedonobacterales bacterium]